MTHLTNLKYGLCFAIGIAIAACGGGGESGIDGNPAFVTSGKWVDQSGNPIAGATVAVQLDKLYAVTTDASGGFELKIPQDYAYPRYFAGSISKTGFLPSPIFFEFNGQSQTSSAQGKSVSTRATTDADVVYASGIGVTHLGDDSFAGSANSQLQIAASGTFWIDKFVISPEQKAKYNQLCVSIVARGVQSSSREDLISLSKNGAPGTYLVSTLGDSDADGAYSQLSNCFSLSSFAAGDTIQLQINSGNKRGSDYDDFEFINVLGLLSK